MTDSNTVEDRPIPEDRIINDKSGIWVNGKNGWYQVANFGIRLLYRITDLNDNISWQASILDGNKERFIELSHEEFSTPARFHTALLRKGYVFKGDKYELNLLKELTIEQAKPCEGIWTLGQHKSGAFLFANGAWNGKELARPNQFNIVEVDGVALYLPFASDLHLKKFRNAARVVYVPSNLTFQQWLAMFAATYGKDGLIPLCFYVASLFRDIAFQKVHFFPILYLRGQKGSGKSSLARSLTALMGYPQPQINLLAPNTAKSLPRVLDQVSNALVWFDEFKNDIPSDIRALLQAVYDGGGYQKATYSTDNLTTSVDIQAALCLTSNFLPDNEIFLSRCCCCTMNSTVKGEDQRKAYDALMSTEAQGLSVITGELLSHRALIAEHWEHTYNALFAHFRKTTTGNMDNRILSNLAVILAPACILEQHGRIALKAVYGTELKLSEEGRATCIIQQSLLTGRSDLNIFFEILLAGAENGFLKHDVDFKIVKHKKHPGGHCLALRLSKLIPYYLKEHRNMYNRIGLSKMEIDALLKNHPAFVDDKTVVHFKTPGKWSDCPATAIILDYDVCRQCFSFTVGVKIGQKTTTSTTFQN